MGLWDNYKWKKKWYWLRTEDGWDEEVYELKQHWEWQSEPYDMQDAACKIGEELWDRHDGWEWMLDDSVEVAIRNGYLDPWEKFSIYTQLQPEFTAHKVEENK